MCIVCKHHLVLFICIHIYVYCACRCHPHVLSILFDLIWPTRLTGHLKPVSYSYCPSVLKFMYTLCIRSPLFCALILMFTYIVCADIYITHMFCTLTPCSVSTVCMCVIFVPRMFFFFFLQNGYPVELFNGGKNTLLNCKTGYCPSLSIMQNGEPFIFFRYHCRALSSDTDIYVDFLRHHPQCSIQWHWHSCWLS